MTMRTAIAASAILLAGTAPAVAQNVGIGTTKGGATAQVSAAIAKVASAKSDLTVRPQPYGNTSQYIPLVNAGRIEFGVSNIFQAWYAVKGTGMSEGRPNPNLRMVAVLFPFRIALYVSQKSGIKTLADLKGKKMPGFRKGALGNYIVNAFFANAGLKYADATYVRIPNFPRMWDGFKRGTIDAAIAAVGSKPTFEMQASVGPVRALGVDPDTKAMDALRKWLPQAYPMPMKASKRLPGLEADKNILAFDYMLFAGKDVSDETVYKMVKALHDNQADMRAAAPLWRLFKSSGMGKDIGLEFHPGAIKFYKEKGIWQGSK